MKSEEYDGVQASLTCTDFRWMVPHFEKMLYDQAMPAIACLGAYQSTRKERYATVAQQIPTYILRDMTSPEGAFHSSFFHFGLDLGVYSKAYYVSRRN